MKFKPTKAQVTAINSRRNTLVSAAAGSGKTAVLVERVLKAFSNPENPLMADRVLIVTFTNAAAAELRLRIEKGLNEMLSKEPFNTLLQRQKILLANAKICTIDSFCLNLIRDNFDKAGVEPSFKVADNSDLRMLLSLSVSKLINDEFNSGNDEFLSLLDYVGSSYDDAELISRICNIYNFSRKMPYPDSWIRNVVESYENFSNGKNDEWFSEGIKIFKEYVKEAQNLISKAVLALEENEDAYASYGEAIFFINDFVGELLLPTEKEDWDEIFRLGKSFNPPSLKALSAKLKTSSSEYAKAQRTAASDMLKNGFKMIYADKEFIRNEINESLPHIKKMAELVIKLGEIFYGELRSRGLMSFDMAEQTALSLLSEIRNGVIVKSKAAEEFISQYDEVMVDEYQDTNNLQDTLFNILSDNQSKLFCVGDAKQSIYRFRGANPFNFISKKKLYSTSEDGFGLRVDLSGNFRSRSEICDYVNRLFSFIMTEENAQIEYDEKECLVPLAEFPNSKHKAVEGHFIDLDEVLKNADLSSVSKDDVKATVEAHTIAALISEYMEEEPFIKENNSLRSARYSDFVILMRSLDNSRIYSSVLKQYNIPVESPTSELLKSDEIITLLSFLKIVDNPYDDVALLTVMTSSLFGFTLDEISALRSFTKKGRLISAVAAAKDNNPKVAEFWNFLAACRTKSVIYKTSDLIDFVFDSTNYPIIVSRRSDGNAKKSGLYAIRDFAVTFEKEGKRGLKEFLNVIDSMIDKDFALNMSSGENAVRIMTIHASKGLQFPVCILADCEHQFNFQDCYKQLLLNEKHGFSFKYYDEEKNENSETLLRVLMSEYEKNQVLSEEVRLLYVALTRAEDKLITTACVKNLKKKIEKHLDMGFFENGKIKSYVFKKSHSYSDWIFAEDFLNGADRYIDYLNNSVSDRYIHTQITLPNSNFVSGVKSDPIKVSNLKDGYDKRYPFEELLEVESKASVTDIVHKADALKFQFSSRPAFMNSGGLTAAQKGTATHKFMQFCDFNNAKSSISEEISRLYEFGYLTEQEKNAVNVEAVSRFFESELFAQIMFADSVKREMNFLCEFTATALKKDLPKEQEEEMIIVQGAVDLLFEKDGKITIIDFKTDRNKNEDELKMAYAEQLRIYKEAVCQLTKLPVERILLYSFEMGREIEC